MAVSAQKASVVMIESIKAKTKSIFDELVDLRRDFHAYPELGFEEVRTTQKIQAAMESIGATRLPCPTATGCIYEIDTRRPGKTVVLRGDIDALPISEGTKKDTHSKHEGIMHACGHDGHAAICLLYTSPSPRDATLSRMPSSA